ncbi:MAG: hypothetical protein R3D98_06080 [Candidatus Krumholzibacteriia bacterium]
MPVHRAAWPDWWSDGIGSAPLETAAVRAAQTAAVAGDALQAAARIHRAELPGDLAAERGRITEALVFSAEHTYGADDSVRDPLAQNTREQWGEKASHAWEAVRRTRLHQETLWGALEPSLGRGPSPTLAVFNPLGRRRDGLAVVNVDHELWPPGRAVTLRDQDGREVPAQPLGSRADGTTWALWLADVPPLGFATVTLEAGPAACPAPRAGDLAELASDHYRLDLDRERGTVRHLHDLDLGRDLVDPEAPWPLLACIHERLGNRHQLEHRRLTDVRREPLADVRGDGAADGPIWRSLAFTGASPGGAVLRWEIRLFKPTARLEVRLSLRNPGTCDPEGWYVAWPLVLPGGRLRYQAQGGLVEPGRNQLPGSSSDWHAVQDLVSLVGDPGQVVLSSAETLLWQFGGLNLGRFRPIARPASTHAYSWVMNNYWTTNFRASLAGEFRWGYALTSLRDRGEGAAVQAGQALRQPLLGRMLPPGAPRDHGPLTGLLTADLPCLERVSDASFAGVRAVRLHLREPDGARCTVPLRDILDPARVVALDRVDPLGRVLATIDGGLELGPHERASVTVRLR